MLKPQINATMSNLYFLGFGFKIYFIFVYAWHRQAVDLQKARLGVISTAAQFWQSPAAPPQDTKRELSLAPTPGACLQYSNPRRRH